MHIYGSPTLIPEHALAWDTGHADEWPAHLTDTNNEKTGSGQVSPEHPVRRGEGSRQETGEPPLQMWSQHQAIKVAYMHTHSLMNGYNLII